MTPVETVHTAARHYCLQQARFWHQKYAKSTVPANSEAGYAIFPRHHVLEAILPEVERMTPEDFTRLDDAVDWLLLAGGFAQSYFTLLPILQQGSALTAIQEERTGFQDFVRRSARSLPASVEPLPFRRTLSGRESDILWSALTKRWHIGDEWWYPLAGPPPAYHLVCWASAFDKMFGEKRLQQVLRALGVRHAFELNEDRKQEHEYEVEVSWIDAAYKRGEVCWTPQGMEWVIYVSQGDTVLFAGELLVEAIQEAWPEYGSALYPTVTR